MKQLLEPLAYACGLKTKEKNTSFPTLHHA